MILIFLKGLLVGFLAAIPIGPMGVLCVRRTLSKGRISGLVSGLGAATVDAFYGGLAALGISLVSEILSEKFWVRLVGGIVLVFIGAHILRSRLKLENEKNLDTSKLAKDYLSAFFLTLTNPTTIISFGAIYAALGLGAAFNKGYIVALLVALGMFIGSLLWWFSLSEAVIFFKRRTKKVSLKLINRICGILILISAVYILLSLVKK